MFYDSFQIRYSFLKTAYSEAVYQHIVSTFGVEEIQNLSFPKCEGKRYITVVKCHNSEITIELILYKYSRRVAYHPEINIGQVISKRKVRPYVAAGALSQGNIPSTLAFSLKSE